MDINKPKLQKATFKIVGTSPLICHAWSEKAKKAMRDKQMKTAVKTIEAKNPQQDYEDSLYRMSGDKYRFPAVAFKAAAVRAAKSVDIPMTDARSMFHVLAEENDLVAIEGEPNMREDMVRLNGKVADIRYRGEFKQWRAQITVQYNAGVISEIQLANLLEIAGFSVGVGEWRPERDGQFGMFTVEA